MLRMIGRIPVVTNVTRVTSRPARIVAGDTPTFVPAEESQASQTKRIEGAPFSIHRNGGLSPSGSSVILWEYSSALGG